VIRDHAQKTLIQAFPLSCGGCVDAYVGANINGAPSGSALVAHIPFAYRDGMLFAAEEPCCTDIPCWRWARIEDEPREASGVESQWREQGALPPPSIRAVTFKVDVCSACHAALFRHHLTDQVDLRQHRLSHCACGQPPHRSRDP